MLAGFLMVSGDGAIGVTPSRDCLFMVPPVPFASPTKDFLAARKHSEFSVSISTEDSGFRLKGTCGPGETFELHLLQSGTGTWRISRDQDSALSGSCELAKGK